MRIARILIALICFTMLVSLSAGVGAQSPIEIRFLFPVQTAGPLATAMEELVEKFNKANPDIHVNAIFTGNYAATTDRIRTSVMAGNPPHVALTDIPQVPVLQELGAIVNLDPYIEREGQDFYEDFIPGFWRNFEIDGHIWGLPFQHSIPLLYYNKDAFAEAGLDPEKPPVTWNETKEYAERLIAHNPKRLALVSPGGSWIFQAFVNSNSGSLVKDLTTPTFDDPRVIESLEYLDNMINKWGLMKIRGWGEAAEDFIAGDTAMMYNSTGSMSFVRTNAWFNWSVAPMPRNTETAFPYGGGGIYLFKGHPKEEELAAWKFMKFLTKPETTAHWSRVSGYFAVRHSAYELPEMKKYLSEFPQAAIAVENLKYTRRQWVTRRFSEVGKLVTDALEEIEVLGRKSPREAMLELQRKVEELLQ